MTASSEVTVHIRGIAVGGSGVGEVREQSAATGQLLGMAAFVPFTAPGETVRARVSLQKDRYLEAQLLEVMEAVPERVAPPCRYYGTCGGCELQHMSYDGQLRAKTEMIRGALRAARVEGSVLDKLATVEPSVPLEYRRRITLHVDSQGRVGFYRAQSRSVVPIESCKVAVPAINELIAGAVRLGGAMPGKITSITIEADSLGAVVALRMPYDVADSQRNELLKLAKEHFPSVTLRAGEEEVGGFGRQMLELPLNEKGTLTLQVPPGAFSQVNWQVNLALIKAVLHECEPITGNVVYDLYAGAGNFTIPLARAGASVIAVETDRALVNCGRQNVKRYNLERLVEFNNISVEKFLDSAKISNSDTIICDPPRNGLGKVISNIPNSRKLVLISCHLPSFVRDLKSLVQSGWRLTKIQPFDMFAQTSYVEILSVYESL